MNRAEKAIYAVIGKGVVKLGVVKLGVVKLGVAYARRRYATQLRFALGFGIAALAIGAYLASRDVAEG